MLAKTIAVIFSVAILTPSAAAHVRVGDIAPSFLGTDRTGDRVDLAQMSGKIVVLVFWTPWYRPAHKLLPVLETLRNSVGGDRLEVISVISDDRHTYRSVARRLNDYRTMVVHDRRGHVRGYYSRGMFYSVIVGTDGRIVSITGYHDEDRRTALVDELKKLLRAQPKDASSAPIAA